MGALGLVVGFAVGVYAWWAVGREPFSASATWAVLVPGVLICVAGTLGPRRSAPRARANEVRGWMLWFGATALWALAAYLQSPREDHPTISSMTNTLLSTHPARALGFVLWLVVMRELARP